MTVAEDGRWLVRPADWSPHARIEAPVSPTLYERIVACPLQCAFQKDGRFPRRSGPAARIGTAFHAAMERANGLVSRVDTPRDLALGLLDAFASALANEREVSSRSYREQNVEWPADRIDAASNSLILLAHRMFAQRGLPQPDGFVTRSPVTEVEVESSDKLIKGIVDRVEHVESGTLIIDYKTSVAEQADISERYRRQVCIYAYLWFERFGEWPIKAIVSYPLLRKDVEIEISADECVLLAQEFRTALSDVVGRDPVELARPGEACRYCDYRPWCAPFWSKRQGLTDLNEALLEARVGIEGSVTALSGSTTHRQLSLSWKSMKIEVSVDLSKWNHVREIGIGTRLRILDSQLSGDMSHPTCELSNRSEIWLAEA